MFTAYTSPGCVVDRDRFNGLPTTGSRGVEVDELYARFRPMVLRRCRRLLKDEELAAEAMQDVFVQIVRRHRTPDLRAPSSLLYTTATNVCLARRARLLALGVTKAPSESNEGRLSMPGSVILVPPTPGRQAPTVARHEVEGVGNGYPWNELFTLAGFVAHNLARELQMRAERPARGTWPKRPARWAFESLGSIRQRLLLCVGRLWRQLVQDVEVDCLQLDRNGQSLYPGAWNLVSSVVDGIRVLRRLRQDRRDGSGC